MKNRFYLTFCFLCVLFQARAMDGLPPGVPRVLSTNGTVEFIDSTFTTHAYQEEALRLVLQEANKVAKELKLEALSIAEENLTHVFISPFGFAYQFKAIGNVTTTNYFYGVGRGCKFSDLTIANYDDYYVKYRDKKFAEPVRAMNTNTAYQLATQWLAAVHMDVKGLNRDCELHIDLTTDMLPGAEKKARKEITPLYFVSWQSKEKTDDSVGSVAYVELYLPTKQLLQLSVTDAKYILRPPLVFTNLAALFPGHATIVTNYPVKTVEGPAPGLD